MIPVVARSYAGRGKRRAQTDKISALTDAVRAGLFLASRHPTSSKGTGMNPAQNPSPQPTLGSAPEVLTDTAPRPRRGRRTVGLAALAMVFPAALLQGLVVPFITRDPATKIAAVAEHPGATWVAALLQLVTALLVVLGVPALVLAVRGRGAGLANAGYLLALLGSFAFAHDSAYDLFLLAMRDDDRRTMTELVRRLDALAAPVELPLMLAFAVSLLLLAGAVWRAGVVRAWTFGLVAAAFLLQMAPPFPGQPVAVNVCAAAGFAVIAARLAGPVRGQKSPTNA